MKALVLALILLSSLIAPYADASGTVKIADHRLSVDMGGIVHLSGIVKNISNISVGSIHIKANLFDSEGNALPTYSTSTLLRVIPPNYVSPFDIPISDKMVSKNISSYTLSLEWKPADSKPEMLSFSELKVFIWTHLDPRTNQFRSPHDPHGDRTYHAHSEISGYIKNQGEHTTTGVKMIVIWYDEAGKYHSYNLQDVAKHLGPEESGSFLIMTHPAMGYYTLLAESKDYVSMLIDKGENIFRVHEANSENKALLGVDTISIKEILVKDSSDKIIDKIPIINKPVVPQQHDHSRYHSGSDHHSGSHHHSAVATDGSMNAVNQQKLRVGVGETIQFHSVISNELDRRQVFLFALNIKDLGGSTIKLYWIDVTISAKESGDITVSWVPEQEGDYIVEVSLLESLSYQSRMSRNFGTAHIIAS